MAALLPLVLSCEHGGRDVPPRFSSLFAGQESLLETHRGYDIGAIEIASRLSQALQAPLIASSTTRLLVDLNRSGFSRTLFSPLTASLSELERAEILDRYYVPHRQRLEALLARTLGRVPRVVHIGVHSFTPVLNGQVRRADIGLLYHPSRPLERGFCQAWAERLCSRLPGRKIRRNYPYRGDSDSFPSNLRACFPIERYLGLQIEVNQRFPQQDPEGWLEVQDGVITTLRDMLSEFASQSDLTERLERAGRDPGLDFPCPGY